MIAWKSYVNQKVDGKTGKDMANEKKNAIDWESYDNGKVDFEQPRIIFMFCHTKIYLILFNLKLH